MGSTKIRPFKGVKDSKEDPEDYLGDIEWAHSQDHASNEPKGDPVPAAHVVDQNSQDNTRPESRRTSQRTVLEPGCRSEDGVRPASSKVKGQL